MKQLMIAGLLFVANSLQAQTYGNMPFTTPQMTNPALIALPELPQLNVVGLYSRYLSSSYIGYSQYSSKLKGSIGINYNGVYSGNNLPYQYNIGRIGLTYAKLFNLNKKWKYALGAGINMAGAGWSYNGETEFNLNLDAHIGGMLYADRFFTGLNIGIDNIGGYQYALRTGYKIQPFKNKDFSVTPILTLVKPFGQGGGPSIEGNLNFDYQKMHLSVGYNNGGMNVGIGYDFKRFRLNYNIGHNFFTDPKTLYHQGGIQFKLSKKHQPQKTEFNHRLC